MKKIKPSTLNHDVEFPYARDGGAFHEHHDNRSQYVGTSHRGGTTSIRVPSLKRNKRTWKNFYKLFPFMEDEEWLGRKRVKLKKL